jgi:hypothetical protein
MTGDFLIVNGERIPKSEVIELLRMIMNQAKEIAGVFHGMNRSEKFRADWPDEKVYAEGKWRFFMEAARALYAERLGDPQVPEYDKQRMFRAIALWQQVEDAAPEKFGGMQIMPGSQQFEGDKRENAKITATWGKHALTFMELASDGTRH